MLLSLRLNNCMIYNSEVEFTMHANMHFKRFSTNVLKASQVNVLKTAVLFGPNNTGKTSFVRCIEALKQIMLNKSIGLSNNIFSDNPIVEMAISFLQDQKEYFFEIKYDVAKQEYIYERIAEIVRDKYKNVHYEDLLVRDSANKCYYAKDNNLIVAMKVAARKNLTIYLMDTESFPDLKKIKDTVVSFASRIDIVDMNNIPIQKTIDMLKLSEEAHCKIARFIQNADLLLDDYRYLTDDELKISIIGKNDVSIKPQEQVLLQTTSVMDMLHLASVYKGVALPSMLFDSTGTKKMAVLASYVIDALEKGRVLIVDELDSSLHFKLTRAIIALFNNELNQSAQLIATVHDVSLLDCQTLFRKEQIWFTYKDHDSTYLYSLAEFTADRDGIRDTSDLIEKYKKGIFGALPEPDLFQSLLEVKGLG